MRSRLCSSSCRLSLALALGLDIPAGLPVDLTASVAVGRQVGSDAGRTPDVDVPLEPARGTKIVVRGAIGELDGLRLLLDTGTFRTVVSERVGRELGVEGTADAMEVFGRRIPAARVALPPLRLGPIDADGLSVLVADLSGLGARLGWQPDVIVGLDVLRGHCFVVDYRARRLRFACTDGWASQVACDPRGPYLTAPAAIDGRDHRLLIDTGSDALVIFERAAPAPRSDDRTIAAHDVAGIVRLRRFTADTFRIGSSLLRNQEVFVMPGGDEDLGFDGILGTAGLAPRVQLDLRRMVVSWTR